MPTTPFTVDQSQTKDGNYARAVVYTWGLDPAVEHDPQYDYFVVMITGTTLSANGWCTSNETSLFHPLRDTPLPAQSVELSVGPASPSGTVILPEISPKTGDVGNQQGQTDEGVSVTVGAEGDLGVVHLSGSVTGSLSWSQTVYQWEIGQIFSIIDAAATKAGSGVTGLQSASPRILLPS